MDIKLEFLTTLCCPSVFVVNAVKAKIGDFGELYDRSPDTAEEYGCGDMRFTRIPPSQEVLDKYKISKVDYSDIADRLEGGLSFGRCGRCI